MIAPKSKSGSALFIVLGCVALMTLLVVAFLGASLTERSTSNFYAKEVNSKLLSETAVNMVLAQLRTGTRSVDPAGKAGIAWASQPGMIRTYDSSGNPDGYYKLYSAANMMGTGAYDATAVTLDNPDPTWLSEPDLYTDLNEPVNSHNPIVSAYDANGNPLQQMTIAGHANVLTYNSTGTASDIEGFFVDPSDPTAPATDANNQVPMPVKWIYILSDGTQVLPTANTPSGVVVPNATSANPIVGRIAFWTDDETGKVNLNTASEGTFWDVPTTSAQEDYGTYLVDEAHHGGYITSPTGLATAVPDGAEYQRIPGHPATTSLSTVFGSILPVPSGTLTMATYTSQVAPYYTLTPRYAPGGSMGGTRPSYNNTASAFGTYTASGVLVLPSYRLYTSPDELVFDPYFDGSNRTALTGADTHVWTDPSNVPQGRVGMPITQQFLNETQFFLTTSSKAPEETLFDTPRISLWPLSTDRAHARNVKDNLLAFCSTINHFPYYFQRSSFYSSATSSTAGGNVATGTVYNGATMANIANLAAYGSSQDPAVDMGGSTSGSTITPGSPDSGTSYLDTDIHRNQNLLAYLRALTSADGTVRNIPGFGGNFMAKYGISSNTGISDIDQILVDMFDYIRSEVNTYSLGYSPAYTFTPMNWNGNSGYVGSGSAVPIQVSINGKTVMGLGKSSTVAEVAIVFMPAGFLDQTTLGITGTNVATPSGSTVVSYPPSPGSDGLPDDVPGFQQSGTGTSTSTGTYVYDGIGDPQTTKMQAFVIIRPFYPTATTTAGIPYYRYSVSGLDQWKVDFSGGTNPLPGGGSVPLNFPPSGSAVVLPTTSSYMGLASRSTVGMGYETLLSPIVAGVGRLLQWNSGANSSSTPATYPLYSDVITLPTAANPSAFGGAIGQNNLRPGMLPNTFKFRGGNITITVSSAFEANASDAPVVQTINIAVPDIDSLPIPSYARANTDPWLGQNSADGNLNSTGHPAITISDPAPSASAQGAHTNQYSMEFYTQVPFDIGNLALRLSQSGTYGPNIEGAVIQRGDTVRSLVLNPQSAIHGDIRVVANLPVVPLTIGTGSQNVYTWLGTNAVKDSAGNQIYGALAYTNDSDHTTIYTQLHSLYVDTGDYFSGMLRVNSALNTSLIPNLTNNIAPTLWAVGPGNGSFINGQGYTGGVLVPGLVYSCPATPCVTPELNGAYMDTTEGMGGSILGDWSNGIGSGQDGPIVLGPDEGFQNITNGGFSSPYYMTYGGGVQGGNSNFVSSSFSPNRQIASPVMFGTLPVGVQAGQGWRTLLFCPNPEAKSNHPGFGVGAGAPGPNDYPPYTTPPDHLLLDLFWMPIVEPYAISEPFATAGMINMNYEIEPFSYIHRSTAVRAVLKSLRFLALPNTASRSQANSTNGPEYKLTGDFQGTMPSAAQDSANYRYAVNLDETVDAADSGFQARFALHDIFRSPSEICNIFLVPQMVPGYTYTGAGNNLPANYAATQDWWDGFQLTGDNNRESPYNQIYPRLTTKSNTFQVHFRVQTLVKNHGPGSDPTVFDTTKGDSVGGEYRGSSIIERYIDPNDTTLPDFATAFTNSGTTLDNYYRFRVVRSKSFTP